MAERRALSFQTLDQVMPEVDRLLDGHATVGRWSLGQICNHLASMLVCSVEGFPVAAPWLVRATAGALKRKRSLGTGVHVEGMRHPEGTSPKENLEARAEAEALRATLGYYASHQAPLAPHALLGPMSRAEWDRYHAIHCAHHLSFVLPKPESPSPDAPRAGK